MSLLAQDFQTSLATLNLNITLSIFLFPYNLKNSLLYVLLSQGVLKSNS